VTAKPSQLDSMASQMELLSRFADALSVDDPARRAMLRRLADRLLALARHLQPSRAIRTDRPAGARAAPTAPAAPAGAAEAKAAAPAAKPAAPAKAAARKASRKKKP